MMWTGLVIALAVIVLLPVLAEAMRRPVGRALQDQAPGKIAVLSQGKTHYQWHGPDDGPVAICIHGLSTPSYVFAGTAQTLGDLGYRVLTYDLYGRGYSDRVAGPQTADFFLRQLRDLLRDQMVDREVLLMGFSMGALIATAYTAEEGAHVEGLVLAAPAGLWDAPAGETSAIWRAPVVGWWLTLVAGGWALRRQLIEHKTTPTIVPDLEDRQAAETKKRGFLPAILSSRRNLLSQNLVPPLEHISRIDTPVLALWGTEDPVVPITSLGVLAKAVPDAHHAQITGASHNLLQTHPAQVAEHLKRFLQNL